MNPDTGHLVTQEVLERMDEEKKKQYKPLPQRLNRAAKRKLAGKGEATVSLTSGGKLSQWAAQERKKKRRKTARASRKRNR